MRDARHLLVDIYDKIMHEEVVANVSEAVGPWISGSFPLHRRSKQDDGTIRTDFLKLGLPTVKYYYVVIVITYSIDLNVTRASKRRYGSTSRITPSLFSRFYRLSSTPFRLLPSLDR